MNLSLFVGMRYTGARRRSQLVSFISRVCITGLVLSVALLIVILSVMNGFEKEFRQRMLSVIPQVTVMHNNGIQNWRALREQVSRVPTVVDSAPYIQVYGMIFVNRRNVQEVSLFGIDPAIEPNVSGFESFLIDSQLSELNSASQRGLFLGRNLANELGVRVGDKVKIVIPPTKVEGFDVIGLFDTGTEVDNVIGLTSIEFAQSLSPWQDRVTGVRLKLDDVFYAPSVANYVRSEIAFERGYYTSNWTNTHNNLYYAIRQSKELVGLLLVLIIGIACFNLVSTLVMVVVDKQGDIAILRTLGATTNKIMAIFMVQGCFIGVIGTGVGLLIGIPLAFGIESIIQFVEQVFNFQLLKSDAYPISFVPTEPLFADIILIAGTALGLSLVATLYPARRASKVKPAEALRFEV